MKYFFVLMCIALHSCGLETSEEVSVPEEKEALVLVAEDGGKKITVNGNGVCTIEGRANVNVIPLTVESYRLVNCDNHSEVLDFLVRKEVVVKEITLRLVDLQTGDFETIKKFQSLEKLDVAAYRFFSAEGYPVKNKQALIDALTDCVHSLESLKELNVINCFASDEDAIRFIAQFTGREMIIHSDAEAGVFDMEDKESVEYLRSRVGE